MIDELARLRADLEVFERHGLVAEATFMRNKIAHLEAEAADPWREAKEAIERYRGLDSKHWGLSKTVAEYVDHLTAENDRLAARVAELEGANTAWKEAASVWTVESEMVDTPERLSERIADLCGVKPLADMQPPFEGPIVGIEPVLDPARVLATAVGIMEKQGWVMTTKTREDLMGNVQPYRLKGDGE